jgi:2-polyprenyl-3-methyl-5-hydroxy-6-metoxy-1,4-benzoquinol methylase
VDECSFDKYRKAGAIHWQAVSKGIGAHNLPFDARYRACVDLLKGVVAPADAFSIADLGCGDGTLFYYLRKAFPAAALTGIDGSPEGIELAGSMLKEHSVGEVSLKLVDFATLDSVKDRYDVVVSLDAIEHVEDTAGFLSNIKDLLKPGGHTVISTPVRIREFPADKEHVREFFPAEFREMVEEAGLKVVEYRQITPIYYLIRYFKATRLGIGKTKLYKKYYNLLNIAFGRNKLLGNAPNASYELYETQFVVAKKEG